MELNKTELQAPSDKTTAEHATKSDVQLLMGDQTREGIIRKKEFTKEQELKIRRIFN